MDDRFPIIYQIACIVLTALFVWSFSIAREPRQWRRLFQSTFSKATQFSVNKNKVIDESLKKWGILIAMVILVVDVACFVAGVTYSDRMQARRMSDDDWYHLDEQKKIQGGSSSGASGGAGLQ
jgi:flagellar biosynthesis protein FlhB